MPFENPDIFDLVRLPPELDAYLRDINPWWAGKPGRVLPKFHRWVFDVLLKKLHAKLAPAVVLRGARQVGKTTLQEQTIQYLLQQKKITPNRILRVQFDEFSSLRELNEPILAIVRWYENRVLGCSLNEAAHDNREAYIFFDEVQNLPDWAPQLKAIVDHHTVRLVVTGSSSLRIEAGRDSLAGRVTTIEMGTLLLREIAGIRGEGAVEPLLLHEAGLRSLMEPDFWEEVSANGVRHQSVRDRAFAAFSSRGGYPVGHANPDTPWHELADHLNETVIQRVIQHDLRLGEKGRKRDPQLLEEVFRLACRYAGQSPGQAIYVNELRSILRANVGWQRILSYLRFLDGALLLHLVRPLELRLKRLKGSHKICLIDPGLRASWLEESIPLDPIALAEATHLSDLAGHLAESVVGAFLADIPNMDIAHFPQRATEPEVDYILTVGERRIPVEVKYRKGIDAHRDTVGLRSFIEKAHYNAPFGILVTMDDKITLTDPRLIPVSLRSLLLMR
ncbi:MAG: AAA family ATPase [Planctomycetia bacterium]|nr:AAA family ATPase [Planctomycetia bacterium]